MLGQESVAAFLLPPLIVSAYIIIIVLPFWKIFSKAGYNGAFSILMLVPFVNIILLFYLAFAEWPILKEIKKGKIFL